MTELCRERVERRYQRAATMEERVECLEESLQHTQDLIRHLVEILEQRFGEDIDDDGHIGTRLL